MCVCHKAYFCITSVLYTNTIAFKIKLKQKIFSVIKNYTKIHDGHHHNHHDTLHNS